MEIRIDGSEIDVFALIRGLIIALGIMLIILAIIRYRKKTQNAYQPMESAQATVVDRQPVGTVPTAYGIWIVFDLADGRRLKLYDKGIHRPDCGRYRPTQLARRQRCLLLTREKTGFYWAATPSDFRYTAAEENLDLPNMWLRKRR